MKSLTVVSLACLGFSVGGLADWLERRQQQQQQQPWNPFMIAPLEKPVKMIETDGTLRPGSKHVYAMYGPFDIAAGKEGAALGTHSHGKPGKQSVGSVWENLSNILTRDNIASLLTGDIQPMLKSVPGFSMDPAGNTVIRRIEKGLCKDCTIIQGRTALTNADGKFISIASGVYLHHIGMLPSSIGNSPMIVESKCGAPWNNDAAKGSKGLKALGILALSSLLGPIGTIDVAAFLGAKALIDAMKAKEALSPKEDKSAKGVKQGKNEKTGKDTPSVKDEMSTIEEKPTMEPKSGKEAKSSRQPVPGREPKSGKEAKSATGSKSPKSAGAAAKPVSVFSTLPNLLFVQGVENFTTWYTTRNGSLDSGYYSGKDDWNMIAEVVNYKPQKQQVYVTVDYEYVPGRTTKDAFMSFVSVTGCLLPTNENPILLGFKTKSGKSTYRGPPLTISRSGTILNARGHMHDGGEGLRLFINDKEVCYSKVSYGGSESTMKEADGRAWETINSMSECIEPIHVKKGDILRIDAEIDTNVHPGRKTAGMETEEMGVYFLTFVPDQREN